MLRQVGDARQKADLLQLDDAAARGDRNRLRAVFGAEEPVREIGFDDDFPGSLEQSNPIMFYGQKLPSVLPG
jgi:hypothetical protein